MLIKISRKTKQNGVSTDSFQNKSDLDNYIKSGNMDGEDVKDKNKCISNNQIIDFLKENITHLKVPVQCVKLVSPQDTRSMFYLRSKVNSNELNNLYCRNYLCINGVFNNFSSDFKDCLFVGDRQTAQRLKQNVVEFITKKTI